MFHLVLAAVLINWPILCFHFGHIAFVVDRSLFYFIYSVLLFFPLFFCWKLFFHSFISIPFIPSFQINSLQKYNRPDLRSPRNGQKAELKVDEFQPKTKNVSKNDFKSSRTLNDVLKVYAFFAKSFSCCKSEHFTVARAINGERP